MDEIPDQEPNSSGLYSTSQLENSEPEIINHLNNVEESISQTNSSDTIIENKSSQITEEEFSVFVGKGWEHYQKAWKPAITGEGKIRGFNAGAFFFSLFWLCYRKMFRYAFVIFGINLVFSLVNIILRGPIKPGLSDPSLIFAWVMIIITAIFGNRWYFSSAKRAITQVHNQRLPQEETLKLIAKKGGRGFWAALGIWLLFSGVINLSTYGASISIPPLYPGSAEAYFNRGMMFYHRGRLDKAIGDYNRCLQLNPNYIEAYAFRGIAYLKENDPDRAISDFDQVIKQYPNEDSFYSWRGLAYESKGDLYNSILDFDHAIEINPNDASSYYYRGIAYSYNGEYEDAIADFHTVLELCGNDSKLCDNARQQLEILEGTQRGWMQITDKCNLSFLKNNNVE